MISFESHAKINIGLKITGERPDGYHTIRTVYQELVLADTVILEPLSDGWEMACNTDSVPRDRTNLVVKAYLKLKGEFPTVGGVAINLEKRIPPGAGLGGGSSDAAAVLKGINHLYQLGLTTKQLEDVALSIGADVPFFIRGGTLFAEGVGEILSPVVLPPMGAILLVIPAVRISTGWAYRHVRNHLSDADGRGKFSADFMSHVSWEFFENDFESLVFQTYPEIGDIKRRLLDAGAVFASLSGSGSTVFGIFRNEDQALEAQRAFPPPLQTFLTFSIIR